MESEYLDSTAAAKFLGMSRQNFFKRYKDKLKPYKLDGHLRTRKRYLLEDLKALLVPLDARDKAIPQPPPIVDYSRDV